MMYRRILASALFFQSILVGYNVEAQVVENKESLKQFVNKLNARDKVTNIVLIGDSHIQAGYISEVLANYFHAWYGSAGRGLIFPYRLANTNGELNYTSRSNQPWITFRSVHKQKHFSQFGAMGFVMKNNKESIIEIKFKQDIDSFNKVVIYNDSIMKGGKYFIFESPNDLSNYTEKEIKTLYHVVDSNETLPELAAKYNTTTTKLNQLNGNALKELRKGMKIKVENVNLKYNDAYEKNVVYVGEGKYESYPTTYLYAQFQRNFIFKTQSDQGNLFYGFRFVNTKAKSGVIFNTIGVNGATYKDYYKYDLQVQQISSIKPDLLIFSLGTNEAFSNITKEEYKKDIENAISAYRAKNPNVAIILIAPTDNKTKAQKVKEIVQWTKEASIENNVAFINQYVNMGGAGYFEKAMSKRQASSDGVHFLPAGYTAQGEMIWNTLKYSKIVNK